MVHMISKFWAISGFAKAHDDGMHAYGLPTSKILGYMVGIAGAYSLLGFTKKDTYNYIDCMKSAKVFDNYMNAAIIYLQGKEDIDPMSINLTDEDGPSRVDYQHFSDVVAFDSTYNKNNSNNHKQTTIFGIGLLEVICDKMSSVIMTDGDELMIAAVREVFPEATNWLCAWHL
ncbi:hypothetical protein Ahy_B01g056606 [Arachis hypogaea]|uniref:Uncharacterized protein n=1 Tax=Arachis hypogaea TaxID=3818 RepID=A0A445AZ84_ARAHY|nr:hypothetical protein Ahy_B01g056606 [Arachis hypogaea]